MVNFICGDVAASCNFLFFLSVVEKLLSVKVKRDMYVCRVLIFVFFEIMFVLILSNGAFVAREVFVDDFEYNTRRFASVFLFII